MSITNRLRTTAWLSTPRLGTVCAYAFVQADNPGLTSVSDASTRVARDISGQPSSVSIRTGSPRLLGGCRSVSHETSLARTGNGTVSQNDDTSRYRCADPRDVAGSVCAPPDSWPGPSITNRAPRTSPWRWVARWTRSSACWGAGRHRDRGHPGTSVPDPDRCHAPDAGHARGEGVLRGTAAGLSLGDRPATGTGGCCRLPE